MRRASGWSSILAAVVAACLLAACTDSPEDGRAAPDPSRRAGVSTGSSAAPGPPSPSEAPTSSPILVVHGFALTAGGYDCSGYWGALERAFRGWDPNARLVTVGFVSGDRTCDVSIGSDGPGTPIETVGRQLAQYVYRTYSRHGIAVDLVGHSMGGLIIRSALTEVAAGSPGWPPSLLVPRAVTISTPHGGAPSARLCPADLQCREMTPGSDYLSHLGRNPQATGGTTWTLIGSAADRSVPGPTSVDMPADRRLVYESPAYTHFTILTDASQAMDARWRVVRGGRSTIHGLEPHSLRAVYLTLTAR